jgi:hypothetical protein
MDNKNHRGSDFRAFLRKQGILGEVESRASALHAKLVMEAVQSGPTMPPASAQRVDLTPRDWV